MKNTCVELPQVVAVWQKTLPKNTFLGVRTGKIHWEVLCSDEIIKKALIF